MKNYTVFTDGASRGNPGPGGFGVIIFDGETVKELGGAKDPTTNNEMELKAVVEALQAIEEGSKAITIYTDSKYVVDGATGWIFGWIRNGWETKTGEPIKNKELWQALQRLLVDREVTWEKVPGHVDLPGNERADQIASGYAKHDEPGLYQGSYMEYDIDLSIVTWDTEKAAERSKARERSRAKAYSYVSLVDGEVQVHQTWSECELRVKGKPAKFKKALDAEEEKAIISDFKNT